MSAESYNRLQLEAGKLTMTHITQLVEFWQRHHSLSVDGYGGPNTRGSLDTARGPQRGSQGPSRRCWPLVSMPDGRKPVITSSFYTENSSRPNHMGVDLFYRWLDSDPDVPVGDGGAIKRNGKRRWWYPPLGLFPKAGEALAASAGKVTIAGKIGTGYRCWVDHGDGLRSGYFHLESLYVCENQVVSCGDSLGVVGDSPKGHDGKHLHFEISPSDKYAPMNPRKWLESAEFLK